MAEKTVKALPLVPQQYDPVNESINRRTIEQAIQDVNSEIGHVKDMQESGVSKAVKRHIFLLMGASHCCFNGGSISMMLTALSGIKLPDNEKIFFGDSNDFQIYHNGINQDRIESTSSFLILEANNHILRNNGGSEDYAKFLGNGAVELYHNGSKKFETTATGAQITGTLDVDVISNASGSVHLNDTLYFQDNSKAVFGDSSDLEIYHDGSNSYIKDVGTGNLRLRGTDLRLESSSLAHNFIVCTEGGSVTAYHNDSSKLSTTATGINVTGVITTDGLTTSADINFGDNDKAIFGAGSDLQIYHDGSNSYVKDAGTGTLRILSDDVRIMNAAGTEISAQFLQDGEARLKYDNVTKLATKSTGIDVTGTTVTDILKTDGGTYTAGIDTQTDAALVIPQTKKIYSLSSSDNYLRNIFYHDDTNGHYIFGQTGTGLIGDMLFYAGSSGNFRFYASGSEDVRIDNQGRLGVGTSSPSTNLEVKGGSGVSTTLRVSTDGTATPDPAIQLYRNSGAYGEVRYNPGGSIGGESGLVYTDYRDDTSSKHIWKTRNAEKMRLDSVGNLGIGTDSPDKKLHIQGSTATGMSADSNTLLRLDNNANNSIQINSGTSSLGQIRFGDADSNYRGALSYSHSANAFSFVTNGAERLKIDSSGNVGIGTTSPSKKLHISSTLAESLVEGTNNSVSALVAGVSVKAYFYRKAGFTIYDESDNEDFFIGRPYGSTNSFLISNDGTSRLRINSSGNVGIGTDSPSKKLHISTGDTNVAALFENTSSNGTVAEFLTSGDGRKLTVQPDHIFSNGILYFGSGSYTNVYRAGAHIFQEDASNTEIMRITGNKVGIGTSSPQNNLHVNAGTGGGVTLEANANVDIDFRYRSGGVNKYNVAYDASAGSLIWYDNTANTTRMTLDSSGNFGIGTTPAAKLDVLAGGDQRIIFGTLGTDPFINAVNAANSSYKMLQLNGSVMRLMTGGSEAARIDASQNLMVGGTNSRPAEFNHPKGISFRGDIGQIQASTDGNLAMLLNRDTSDGTIVEFRKEGSAVGSISVTGSATAFNTSSDARLKDVTGTARGLEVINELNPVAYNWKANGKADEGLIAQEVKELVPNAVVGSEEDMYSMDYSKLVVHLVAGMKEQQEQIESLKSEINKLKGK